MGHYQRCLVLLVDDLKFRSPADDFDSADAFIERCWALSEQFSSMDILHQVYDGEAGYLVYRSGEFCAGELVKLRDGKISEIYVTFNPTA